jgi:hypothetical protein
VHVAIVDMPAFFADFRIAAAGEFGHAAVEAQSQEAGKSRHRLGSEQIPATADRGC